MVTFKSRLNHLNHSFAFTLGTCKLVGIIAQWIKGEGIIPKNTHGII